MVADSLTKVVVADFISFLSCLSVVMYYKLLSPVDTDECTTNTHNCHSSATCNNTIGSFNCTCNKGYNGDGISCSGEQCLVNIIAQENKLRGRFVFVFVVVVVAVAVVVVVEAE